MKEKTRQILCRIINSIILAGIIILLIGLYYMVVKAGIPYQDPTVEMQIKYAVNMGIGETLAANGFVLAVSGGIIRLVLWLINKRS